METYTIPKELVENPDFEAQKQETLAGLNREMIDAPIVAHIEALNRLPYCFTLQCCYGHFLYIGQPDPQNLAPLPVTFLLFAIEFVFRIYRLGHGERAARTEAVSAS